MFIPTYNQKNKHTCQKSEKRMNEKKMWSYLSGLRINSTLMFMSSSSYLVHAISCRRILLKYRVLQCFFLFWFPLFLFFYFLLFTRQPSPVTRLPSPATRHPRKSPAADDNDRRSKRFRLKEQYPVTVHAPNFDFRTGCREIKRCEESKRTLKNPFASRLASSIIHWNFSGLQINHILFPLSFDLGEIGIFWHYFYWAILKK